MQASLQVDRDPGYKPASDEAGSLRSQVRDDGFLLAWFVSFQNVKDEVRYTKEEMRNMKLEI